MNQNQHVVEERDHKKGKISLFRLRQLLPDRLRLLQDLLLRLPLAGGGRGAASREWMIT